MFVTNRGGLPIPPNFTLKNSTKALVRLALAGASLCSLTSFGNAKQGNVPRFPRPFKQRPGPFQRRPAAPKVDPAAANLLKKMLHPTANYSGEQVTETAANGGHTSHQHILGDTRGRIRREYVDPENLAGDIMLYGPAQYRYYHSKTNTLDIALWPTEYDENDKKVINLIKSGQVQIALVGQEIVAGRNATILEMKAPERSRKYWIDPETGVQLKIESSGPRGFISRTYLSSVQIGAAADASDKMFAIPNQNRAILNPLFPDSARYDSLEAATPHLPFSPLVPNGLPMGFQLSGVWIFNVNLKLPNSGSILLRYSDGVGNFSLFERMSKPNLSNPQKPGRRRLFRGNIQNWKETLPNGNTMDVTYIGHLTANQTTALHDSLH